MAIRVTYHHEEGRWWADSPDIDGFVAGADTLEEVRALVHEGVALSIEQGLVAPGQLVESTDAGDRLYGTV